MTSSHYHHGDLRTALLDAALVEIEDRGVEHFSLRNCAKRVGVSHAAPKHHFADTNALLSALATRGYEDLAAQMTSDQSSNDSFESIIAACTAYVAFARNNASLFALMYAGRINGYADETRLQASETVFSVLVNGLARLRGRDIFKSEAGWRDVTALFSMLHGYSTLATAGRMPYATTLPDDAQNEYIADMVKRLLDA